MNGVERGERILANDLNYVQPFHLLVRLQHTIIQLKSLLRQVIRQPHMQEVRIVARIEPMPEGRYLHCDLPSEEAVVPLLVDVD